MTRISRYYKNCRPTLLLPVIISLRHVADLPGRQRLRSASSADLAVPQTRLQTVGDRAFCVATAKIWNSLPSEVTSSVTLSTFKQKLKTYLFFTVISQHVISPHIDVQWLQCFCICSLKIMIDWTWFSTPSILQELYDVDSPKQHQSSCTN